MECLSIVISLISLGLGFLSLWIAVSQEIRIRNIWKNDVRDLFNLLKNFEGEKLTEKLLLHVKSDIDSKNFAGKTIVKIKIESLIENEINLKDIKDIINYIEKDSKWKSKYIYKMFKEN